MPKDMQRDVLTTAEIDVLIHHYEVEVNRWAKESPEKYRTASDALAYWQDQRGLT